MHQAHGTPQGHRNRVQCGPGQERDRREGISRLVDGPGATGSSAGDSWEALSRRGHGRSVLAQRRRRSPCPTGHSPAPLTIGTPLAPLPLLPPRLGAHRVRRSAVIKPDVVTTRPSSVAQWRRGFLQLKDACCGCLRLGARSAACCPRRRFGFSTPAHPRRRPHGHRTLARPSGNAPAVDDSRTQSITTEEQT